MPDDVNTDVLPTPSAETPAGGASDAPELEELLEEAAVGDDQAAGADDEIEDWEDEDGKKYPVHKALKSRLMKDRDYTHGKQQLAAERKADEANRKAFADEQKFFRENMKEAAKIQNMNDRLAAFEAITDEQWSKIDAGKAAEMHMKYTRLKTARDTAFGELQRKEREALDKQRETDAKRFEDGFARIAKEIPGWSDELASKLNDYATSTGYSVDELERMPLTPHTVGTLHKAYLYDQLVAKQRARAKTATAADTPAPTPVPKLNPRRQPPSSEPLDTDDIDTWRRKREKQLGIVRSR